MTDLALVRACEERIVNCWPAVDTLLIDGFVVRFANGYSGRANSATPIEAGADLPDNRLARIEQLYREAGLPSQVRITPLAASALEPRLLARGYVLRDESIGMTGPLPEAMGPGPDGVTITVAPRAGDDWIAGVSALQDAAKREPRHLAAIVGRIRVPAGFATLSEAGRDLGYGMVSIDRGMAELASIILAPEHRGRGLGSRLLAALGATAREAGAETAFLQVEGGNARAQALYRRLGFGEAYRYRTYRRAITAPPTMSAQASASGQPASARPASTSASVEITGAA